MGESSNRFIVAGGLCVVALLVGGVIGNANRTTVPPAPGDSAWAQPIPASVEVHVAGLVANPGVVTVAEDAIVADAIAAAGGLLASADPTAVNLAAPISTGQQIVVPGQGGDGDRGATASNGLISLNQASESELQDLPGVGPVLAGRIVAYRDSDGPFQAVEDLLQVPGIGEAKLASIRDLVRP